MPFSHFGIFNIRVGCESTMHCVTWVSRKCKYLESFDNLAPKWTWKTGQVESNFLQYIYICSFSKVIVRLYMGGGGGGKEKGKIEICMITMLIYISFFCVKSLNSDMSFSSYHQLPSSPENKTYFSIVLFCNITVWLYYKMGSACRRWCMFLKEILCLYFRRWMMFLFPKAFKKKGFLLTWWLSQLYR